MKIGLKYLINSNLDCPQVLGRKIKVLADLIHVHLWINVDKRLELSPVQDC